MQHGKSRVLIVSGRSLVAQALKSLLAGEPEISQVEVIGSLYDALVHSLDKPPDAMVIDLPAGADLFVDRPISIEGHEIKTIVLVEGDQNVQARIYVHIPGRTANLENLMAAILWDGQGEHHRHQRKPDSNQEVNALADASAAALRASQPANLIKARASDPSNPRMASSSEAS